MTSMKIKLPLLILDEAHHLKNAHTKLSGLFQVADAESDAEEISRGPLGGVFERMLFLTATPFQLGHHELCSVLDRFTGIAWDTATAPGMGQAGYQQAIKQLRTALDAAQEAGVRLDTAWGTLTPEDLVVGDATYSDVEQWWQAVQSADGITPNTQTVITRYAQAKDKLRAAETLLRPWVTRHQRAKSLPGEFSGIMRRKKLPGEAITRGEEQEQPIAAEQGIGLEGEALLPFLLSARASALKPEARPVFAEGLASCYEAFLHTRNRGANKADSHPREALLDQDDLIDQQDLNGDASVWYLDQLETMINLDNIDASLEHPKIKHTVAKALALWEQGEKVLIFCHYVLTGRVLQQHISNGINNRINYLASKKLNCTLAEAPDIIERIGDRFFDQDSPVRRTCDQEVARLLQDYEILQEYGEVITDVVRRFLRTPSFLARFFPLQDETLTPEHVAQAFAITDASGMTITRLLQDFFKFLANHCGAAERAGYLDAIKRVQVGKHRAADVVSSFSEDELQHDNTEMLVPNVRLVNGSVAHDSRQRLMLAFNTPFYPEILIASSVLAEGVDLHLNCRYIIHHDLSWNPSTLEQRTGRVDRIGAKVERSGVPIHLYFPYIAETQDEKMYRVVMDRERWFNVVMGEKYFVDARTTEKMAQRIAFPETAAEGLRFGLEVEVT